jgi:hypothetical protein
MMGLFLALQDCQLKNLARDDVDLLIEAVKGAYGLFCTRKLNSVFITLQNSLKKINVLWRQ